MNLTAKGERFGAIVLAAGASRRYGDAAKLAAPFRGAPLIRAALLPLFEFGCEPVVAVSGADAAAVKSAAEGVGDLQWVINPDPAEGMGRSLALGALALQRVSPVEREGVFIVLADMPGLCADDYAQLSANFDSDGAAAICHFTTGGPFTPPVLFAREFLERLGQLSGDEGARSVVKDARGRVKAVTHPEPHRLYDIDTREDLERHARA